MTKSKPLPEIGKCPFKCGPGSFVIWVGGARPNQQIHCARCGMHGPMRRTKRGAILGWNEIKRGKE